ncbi:MAG TPA: hypothetical protein VIV58_14200 [Kofleriaceae bacterium]
MRIPPSAIVMTLLVAVPFGFAVRDTLKGNDPQTVKQREEAQIRVEEQKAHEEELAEQQAQYEREKKLNAEREQTYATIIGKDIATLGERFGGTQVGMKVSDDLEQRLGQVDAVLDVTNHGLQLRGDGTIASVSFTFGDSHCDKMNDILTKAWGPASTAGEIWIDKANHRRASLGGLLCVLHFDQIVDDTAWAKAALPKLIGKTPAQAQKLLGTPTVPLDEPTLSWFLPGPPGGRDSTELSAEVADGKIVSTRVVATVTPSESISLVDALTKQIGKPATKEDYGNVWTWDKPNVTVELNEAMLLSVVTE